MGRKTERAVDGRSVPSRPSRWRQQVRAVVWYFVPEDPRVKVAIIGGGCTVVVALIQQGHIP